MKMVRSGGRKLKKKCTKDKLNEDEDNFYQHLLMEGHKECQDEPVKSSEPLFPPIDNGDETYQATLRLQLKTSCKECNQSFMDSISLQRHHQTVHDSMLFKCFVCSKGFKHMQACRTHLEKVHNINKAFKCDACGTFFKRKWDLKTHYREHHEPLPSFPCTLCDKVFPKRHLMNTHLTQYHYRTRLFECNLCSKTFITKSCLSSHHRLVHVNIRPFACLKCPSRFKDKNVLLDHVRVIHDHIKKYECGYCFKTFGHSSTHQRHVLVVHKRVKKFSCHMCQNVSYVDKRSLTRHFELCHKEETVIKIENEDQLQIPDTQKFLPEMNDNLICGFSKTKEVSLNIDNGSLKCYPSTDCSKTVEIVLQAL